MQKNKEKEREIHCSIIRLHVILIGCWPVHQIAKLLHRLFPKGKMPVLDRRKWKRRKEYPFVHMPNGEWLNMLQKMKKFFFSVVACYRNLKIDIIKFEQQEERKRADILICACYAYDPWPRNKRNNSCIVAIIISQKNALR